MKSELSETSEATSRGNEDAAVVRGIPSSDKIPILQKACFAAGVNMDYFSVGLVTSVLWMPFFNIGLGIEPAILGLLLMGLRVWDAITDPIVGNLTDNARTRWGRRRPFLLVGALLTAACFPLLWWVPAGMSEALRLPVLVGLGLVYFTVYTIWSMAFYSMQLELTPNYDERTRLSAWMTVISKLSYFLGGWVLALATGAAFQDPETGKPNMVAGVQYWSLWIAVAIAVFGSLPALFVKERYYDHAASRQPRQPLFAGIRDSASCRPMWQLIGVAFFLILGSGSVGALGNYLNIYYACSGDLAKAMQIAGWKMTGIVLLGISTVPLWLWIGERSDKKIMIFAMLCLSIFGNSLNWFLMTPENPWLQIIPALFESQAIAAIWLFLPSMKADVADYDEKFTGRRREGSLNAFFSWFTKAAGASAMGLSGFLLSSTGFSAALEQQTPDTLLNMRLIFLIVPTLCWGTGIFFSLTYPLDRHSMGILRSELEQKRGYL